MVGTAHLSQLTVSGVSPYPDGPAERMDIVTALFLNVGRRWIKLVVKALSASSGAFFFLRFFSCCLHLEQRREPRQRLVKPMFSQTSVTSRPEGAHDNQGSDKVSEGRQRDAIPFAKKG